MSTPAFSHQTVKLGKGKHRSPRDGACVMELAAMLAGEPFSDRPLSVSPVIAAFLRAYNDYVDDDLRQQLYPLASAVVGSRAASGVEKLRIRRVVEWGHSMRRARMGKLGVHFARTLSLDARIDPDEAGSFAVHAIGRRIRWAHPYVLAFVDELLAYGQPEGGPTEGLIARAMPERASRRLIVGS